MSLTIHDTGLTVVFPSSDEESHLVDIVIIHGLQGHPERTWSCEVAATPAESSAKPERRGLLKRLFKKRSSPRQAISGEKKDKEETLTPRSEIFWPADLLPKQCPKARIMVYGYETRVTQGYAHTANQNTVFSHGQDLLYNIRRRREGHKPIIFIAHSLGGIVLKEALIHANNTRDPNSLEVLEAAKAVVFLSTPHQGSDHAQLGEIARRVASALGLDTNAALLDSLGLRNDDLRRSQQLFSNIWDERRFHLKTFQESKALVGFNVGKLNELIVPHKSSLLGLPGEDPETLNADHISMCKFESQDDANFRSFGDEIKRFKFARRLLKYDEAQNDANVATSLLRQDIDVQGALMSLAFENLGLRKRVVERPSPGTCEWPLTHPSYRDWLVRTDIDAHHGLLWLVGHPGSGKSVLVKHLASICATHAKCTEENVATYFFDARGTTVLEKSLEGLLRALLYQLSPLCQTTLEELGTVHTLKDSAQRAPGSKVKWTSAELQDILLKLCSKPRKKPLFVFVDAIDECESSDDKAHTDPRAVILFLGTLAGTAHRADCNLNICISSRRHLTVSTLSYAKIVIDQVGHGDIERYVLTSTSPWQLGSPEKAAMSTEITTRSAGNFLWARLALGRIANAIDDGLQADLAAILKKLPYQLQAFFEEIMGRLSEEQRTKSSRLFQWVLFAQRPLALDEWLHIMALVDMPDLRCLKRWENSVYGIDTVEQLAKRVTNMSGGLLEATTIIVTGNRTQSEAKMSTATINSTIERSVSAYAGSMDAFERGVPAIQFVHESVREYFLNGNGSKLLLNMSSPGFAGYGHIYIMEMCLQYAHLEELRWITGGGSQTEDSPIEDSPTKRYRRAERRNPLGSHVSVASFGSSAASSLHRSPTSKNRAEIPVDNEMALRLRLASSSSPRKEIDEWLERMTPSVVNRSVSDPSPQNKIKNLKRRSFALNNMTKHGDELEDAMLADSASSNAHSEMVSPSFFAALRSSHDALRLYVIDMFVHHAVAAAAEDADVAVLLESIEKDRRSNDDGSSWYKWCCLNEGMRSDTTPAYFAAENNLSNWLDWYICHRPELLHEVGGPLRFPLLAATLREHESVVSRLLPHVAPRVRSSDDRGRTVMHILAALSGGEVVLSQLCDLLSAEESSNLLRSTPLYHDQTPLDILYERATGVLGTRIGRIRSKWPGNPHNPLDRFIRMAGRSEEGEKLHLKREDRFLLRSLRRTRCEDLIGSLARLRALLNRPSFCLHLVELAPDELEELLNDLRESVPAFGLWIKCMSDTRSASHDAGCEPYDVRSGTINWFIDAVEYSQNNLVALD